VAGEVEPELLVGSDGIQHTEQLHVVERYRRPDSNHLDYEIRIDDPGV
jgi:hypothetical protein